MRLVSLRLRPLNKRRALSIWCAELLRTLPPLHGEPIDIQFAPELVNFRGKLLSGPDAGGTPVYAAAYIRERRVVLEDSLIESPPLMSLILAHELFHFVWVRLSNRRRDAYRSLVVEELRCRARGELGESSLVAKARHPLRSPGALRYYVCESFCDTAAWYFVASQSSATHTLAARHLARRLDWLRQSGAYRC